MKKVLILLMALTLSIAGMTGCAGNPNSAKNGETPDNLILAIMMSESGEAEVADIYDDLRQHLEEQVGIPVEIYEVGSYEAGIEALRTGKADMNMFSAFSYYLAKQRADVEPLVGVTLGNDSDASGNTVIITKADSDINTVEDLRGKSFAFVDPASTSGHIAPKYFLINEFGVTVDQLESEIFSQTAFAGGHDSSAIGVINGQYDAGACVRLILNRLEDAGIIAPDDYKIVAETALEGMGSAVAVRKALPNEIKEKLSAAFLSYDNTDFFVGMFSTPEADFCEVDQAALDSIEKVAKDLNLSEEQLLQ